MMTNELVQGNMEVATKLGAENWIIEGQLQSGWYTCILTGKKFRSAGAAAQLAKQSQMMADAEAAEAESEVCAAGEAEMERQEDAVVAEQEAPIDWSKMDISKLSPDEQEQFLADGNASERKWDEYIFSSTGMAMKLHQHLNGGFDLGKVKVTKINCEDCGVERIIKVQDAFQVTRCVPCQHKHRNAIRAEKRKAKREAAKQQSQE